MLERRGGFIADRICGIGVRARWAERADKHQHRQAQAMSQLVADRLHIFVTCHELGNPWFGDTYRCMGAPASTRRTVPARITASLPFDAIKKRGPVFTGIRKRHSAFQIENLERPNNPPLSDNSVVPPFRRLRRPRPHPARAPT
ncbi:hypothetical protein D3C71_1718600 [compost metagenome]